MKYRVDRFQTIVERRTFIVEAEDEGQAIEFAMEQFEYGEGKEKVEICDMLGDDEWEVEPCE